VDGFGVWLQPPDVPRCSLKKLFRPTVR